MPTKLVTVIAEMPAIPPSLPGFDCSIGGSLDLPSLEAFFLVLVDRSKGSSRYAHGDRIGGHVADHYRTRGHDRIRTDPDIRAQDGVDADRAVVLDDDRPEDLQIRHFLAKHPRPAVVRDEQNAVRDGDVIADLYQIGLGPEIPANNGAAVPDLRALLAKIFGDGVFVVSPQFDCRSNS